MQPTIKFDPYWRRSERARTLPCQKVGSSFYWDQDAGRELNSLARETCATVCPFRVDCYMTSYMSGERGMIRGGIMLQGRVRTTTCQRCGLPAIKASKREKPRTLCQVCVCLWDCHGCGQTFWMDRMYEPKTTRHYHSERCQIESMKVRLRIRLAARRERQSALSSARVLLPSAA